MRIFFIGVLLITQLGIVKAQKSELKVEHFQIGTTSSPVESEVTLVLSERFQQYNWHPKSPKDHLDKSIFSPKSAKFSEDGKKLYIQSLEGYSTSIYSIDSMERQKVVKHTYNSSNSALFKDNENTVFDYLYRYRTSNFNSFSGKPVESTLSHNGKYLWITFYRRSFDKNAISPSAVAIMDTETDSVIRVMPTGPLPKMIAASPDNKYVAVTHWGDNTIGIIDISGDDPMQFKYVKHFIVDYRQKLNFKPGVKVNRDVNCGYCLRGTVFTPDSKHLLVGRMGGNGGIAVFEMDSLNYQGTVFGMQTNIRHLAIENDELFIGCNRTGYVQKTNLNALIAAKDSIPSSNVTYNDWQGTHVGYGVRTIEVTSDGKYIFACVNGKNKIVVIRSFDMQQIASIGADSFPVGMALSPDDKKLVVTAQGKSGKGGGNSVMIYDITY